jgi:hypothetical protein
MEDWFCFMYISHGTDNVRKCFYGNLSRLEYILGRISVPTLLLYESTATLTFENFWQPVWMHSAQTPFSVGKIIREKIRDPTWTREERLVTSRCSPNTSVTLGAWGIHPDADDVANTPTGAGEREEGAEAEGFLKTPADKAAPSFLDTFWEFTSDLVMLDSETQEVKQVSEQSKMQAGHLAALDASCDRPQHTVEHASMSLDLSFSDNLLGADQNERGGGGGGGGGVAQDRNEQAARSRDVPDTGMLFIYTDTNM